VLSETAAMRGPVALLMLDPHPRPAFRRPVASLCSSDSASVQLEGEC